MLRNQDAFEAKFLRFADALLDTVHGTDFTTQSHFSGHADVMFYRHIHITRKDGTDDGIMLDDMDTEIDFGPLGDDGFDDGYEE